MKKRWPLLLLIVLAVVAWQLWRTRSNSTLAGPLTDFTVQDTARVDRIFIADKAGGHVDLRRTLTSNGAERWTVDGLPANPIPVNLLLKTFIRVEVKTPVPMSMQTNVLKFMSNNAVKVEIYTGGKEPAKIWWVGHATPDHFGTYCLLEIPGVGKSNSPFVLGMAGFTGIINTRFHTRLDEWRSTDVIIHPDLSEVARVHVEHPSSDSPPYTVTFDGDSTLTLLDAQDRPLPMDTTYVRDLMLHLRDAHFEYFERSISRAQRDSVLATKPWHVITVTDRKGREQRVPFWRKNPNPGEKTANFEPMKEDVDRMYALLNDTALVVVQRYWYDRTVPYLSQLQPKPRQLMAPPPKPSAGGKKQ